MSDDNDRLQSLKAKMTKTQQKEMAELLSAEIARRKQNKHRNAAMTKARHQSSVPSAHISGGTDDQVLDDLYENINDKVNALRIKNIDKQLREIRKIKAKALPRKSIYASILSGVAQIQNAIRTKYACATNFLPSTSLPSARNMILIFGITAFGTLKILLSSGVVSASITTSAMKPSISSSDADGDLQTEVSNVRDSRTTKENKSGPVIIEAKQSADPKVSDTLVSLGLHGITPSDPQSRNWTPIEKELLTQLDSRRVELEKRKETLDSREGELNSLAKAVSEKLLEVQSITKKLGEMRKEKDQNYETRLAQLSDVYGSMGPKEAAPLIAKLDTDIAIALLQRLPGKKLAAILGVMDGQRAVELTKGLTGKNRGAM